jgi:S-adenosylmethionine decarboxylase
MQAYGAEVTYAAGAFNWQVKVGDKVSITDYRGSRGTLTSERSRPSSAGRWPSACRRAPWMAGSARGQAGARAAAGATAGSVAARGSVAPASAAPAGLGVHGLLLLINVPIAVMGGLYSWVLILLAIGVLWLPVFSRWGRQHVPLGLHRLRAVGRAGHDGHQPRHPARQQRQRQQPELGQRLVGRQLVVRRRAQVSAFLPRGRHLLADLHGVAPERLTDPVAIEALLRGPPRRRRTPVGGHFHPFGPGLGVTGVLLLKESHISIHTWPEHGFAAVDVFMCGGARPERAVDVIEATLAAGSVSLRNWRGADRFACARHPAKCLDSGASAHCAPSRTPLRGLGGVRGR